MAEELRNENLDGPFKKSVEDGTEDGIEELVREEVDENNLRLVRKRSLTKVDRSYGCKTKVSIPSSNSTKQDKDCSKNDTIWSWNHFPNLSWRGTITIGNNEEE